MFIGFRVTAVSGGPRKSLPSTERFCFFDIGVRNAAAALPLETAAVRAHPGPLFEQWVGIKLPSDRPPVVVVVMAGPVCCHPTPIAKPHASRSPGFTNHGYTLSGPGGHAPGATP
jgi:hypothetical protein